MKAFLILMVCAAFLTSILTAGRETDWGYKDDGETKIREQFYSINFSTEQLCAAQFFCANFESEVRRRSGVDLQRRQTAFKSNN